MVEIAHDPLVSTVHQLDVKRDEHFLSSKTDHDADYMPDLEQDIGTLEMFGSEKEDDDNIKAVE